MVVVVVPAAPPVAEVAGHAGERAAEGDDDLVALQLGVRRRHRRSTEVRGDRRRRRLCALGVLDLGLAHRLGGGVGHVGDDESGLAQPGRGLAGQGLAPVRPVENLRRARGTGATAGRVLVVVVGLAGTVVVDGVGGWWPKRSKARIMSLA